MRAWLTFVARLTYERVVTIWMTISDDAARGKHEASEARRDARFHAFNYASPTGCTSIIIPAIRLFNAAYLTDLYGVSLLPLNRLELRDPSRLSGCRLFNTVRTM